MECPCFRSIDHSDNFLPKYISCPNESPHCCRRIRRESLIRPRQEIVDLNVGRERGGVRGIDPNRHCICTARVYVEVLGAGRSTAAKSIYYRIITAFD